LLSLSTNLILSLIAAAVTAILIGMIAHDEMGIGHRRYPHRRAQRRWPSLRGGLLRVFAEAQKVMFAMDASGQPHILLQTVAIF
jgi:hypothetical protein